MSHLHLQILGSGGHHEKKTPNKEITADRYRSGLIATLLNVRF